MSTLPAPADVLPHRPPFLLLDEVLELRENGGGSGVWRITGDEDFFTGHFPGRPTLPGVLMLEAIAQLGAYVVLSDERFAGKLPLFGGVEKARFRRQVVPGDVLEIDVELGRLSARAGRGSGRAHVGGETAVRDRSAVRLRRRLTHRDGCGRRTRVAPLGRRRTVMSTTVIDTMIGPLTITAGPEGVVRIDFGPVASIEDPGPSAAS